MLGIKEGEIHFFRSKSFCLTLPKKYIGELIRVSLFWVSTSFMLQWVKSQFFVGIFCLTVPKTFVGDPFSFSLISGNEKC